MTAALKSLSTSSNNSVIGLSFLIQMESAPVLGKRDLFLMQPGHLCISFQILLKPGLADFLCSREAGQVRTLPAAARWGESPGSQWPVLTWGEGVCLLTARKGEGVQVPHWSSIIPPSWCFITAFTWWGGLTAHERGASPSPPRGLPDATQRGGRGTCHCLAGCKPRPRVVFAAPRGGGSLPPSRDARFSFPLSGGRGGGAPPPRLARVEVCLLAWPWGPRGVTVFSCGVGRSTAILWKMLAC